MLLSFHGWIIIRFEISVLKIFSYETSWNVSSSMCLSCKCCTEKRLRLNIVYIGAIDCLCCWRISKTHCFFLKLCVLYETEEEAHCFLAWTKDTFNLEMKSLIVKRMKWVKIKVLRRIVTIEDKYCEPGILHRNQYTMLGGLAWCSIT